MLSDRELLKKKLAAMKAPVKPRIDTNLKMRAMTDPEKAMADYRQRYTDRNGKTTWGGSARLIGDMVKKMAGRSFLGQE